MRMSSIRRVSGMASVEITRRDLDVNSVACRGGPNSRCQAGAAHIGNCDGSRRPFTVAGGMDRQTLRDWVHRYNADGLAGLVDRPRPGPTPRLTEAQMAEVAKWVDDGPDLAADGAVRWRCADLRERVAARFEVTLHECRIGKLLHKLNFSRISVRPPHPKTDLAAQQTFKKNFADMATAAIPPERAGGPIEVWFQDEARVGQQGTVSRIWAKRGSRPRAKRDRRFTWAYLFGAICPARGTGVAVVLPEIGIEAMNIHLAEISRSISVSATALLILDGAGWHSSAKLVVLENIVPMPMPPHAPELNSVENVSEHLRGNFLSHCVWNTYDATVDACRAAWKALMAKSDVITSIGTRDWAQVKT
jgi:transposase